MAEERSQENLLEDLCKSRLAGDLLEALRARTGQHDIRGPEGDDFHAWGLIPVIIEGNSRLPGGAPEARDILAEAYAGQRQLPLSELTGLMQRPDRRLWWGGTTAHSHGFEFDDEDRLELRNSFLTEQYLFADLTERSVLALARATVECGGRPVPLVHKIWLNHAIGRFVFESGRTVKCDAARAAFAAAGEGIVWAVADTGIDGNHFHFRSHNTLELPDGLQHVDFTGTNDPLVDTDGHGTHVAGIIAGETVCRNPGVAETGDKPETVVVKRKVRVSDTQVDDEEDRTRSDISGVAPRCKLMSLRVLRKSSDGNVGTLLAALGYIQKVNDNGRNLRVHGVNLSLGYAFDARWFAAGRSPLCAEVDRLVRSGVVVVVAAGNGGYGTVQALDRSTERASHLATISDPGNSDLAITVGSTHRDSPHSFGISYFSGKGPTADGRMKPDLVAPGERIISAMLSDPAHPKDAFFREDTGTSMAAPHVSGAIAAFLSVRREFKGQPEQVKRIFMESATDLRRQPEFQGRGLIDVMRALQSV